MRYIYTPCSHFLLWNRARRSDAAPPVLWDPPAARPSGLLVMCRVAALSWSARVPCFPCSSRLLGVFSHCFCVCLPATLSCVQVAGFPAAGLRVAGASVWRRKGSGGSRRHPPYPLSRPVPCICAGWCVCVLSPLCCLFFPLPRLIRVPVLPQVCLRAEGVRAVLTAVFRAKKQGEMLPGLRGGVCMRCAKHTSILFLRGETGRTGAHSAPPLRSGAHCPAPLPRLFPTAGISPLR
eukprot:SAG25_NODE_1_length_41698_cov_149.842015_18_plen_236_part_00